MIIGEGFAGQLRITSRALQGPVVLQFQQRAIQRPSGFSPEARIASRLDVTIASASMALALCQSSGEAFERPERRDAFRSGMVLVRDQRFQVRREIRELPIVMACQARCV
jgi:hypothetical protein